MTLFTPCTSLMGPAGAISRAAINFSVNDVHGPTTLAGSERDRPEKLAKEETPRGREEAGKAQGVGHEPRGKQECAAHGQHHAL